MSLYPRYSTGQNGIGHGNHECSGRSEQCRNAKPFGGIRFGLKSANFLATIFLILCLAASGVARGASVGIAIGKSAIPTSALVGNTVVFTIGLTNLESTTLNDIVGSDIVPSGFLITAWNSSGSPVAPVYNPTNGTLTVGSIGPGVADMLTITTTATNNGVYTNVALLTSPNEISASAVVIVTPQTADLMVTKTAALYDGTFTNQFQPGDLAVFTVTITNLGPGTAYNIIGSDVLPGGFTFAGWGNAGSGYYPAYDSTNGAWMFYLLPPGNWGSFSVYATAASTGTFTNTAAITNALDIDPNTNNNSASVVVSVAPAYVLADLGVAKTANESSVTVGDVVTFTIVATNAGPSFVTDAVVSEGLYPGWSFVAASNGPNASFDFNTQAWTISSLPPYASEVLALQAQAISAGWLTNQVVINPPSGVQDPNPANNTSTLALLAVAPPPQADLAVILVAQTNNVYVTNPIIFNVTVTNLGPNDASNITVKEFLPNTLYITDVPQVPAGTSWDPPSRTWTIPNLAVNEAVTLQVAILPLRGGTFTNTVQILASMPTDPVQANNTASVPVTFIGYTACGIATLCAPLGGAPNANATVTLTPLSNSLNTATLTTTTTSAGTFCFTNLLPGTYSFMVTPANPASGISPYQENVIIGPNTGGLAAWSQWLAITGVITFGPGGPPYPNVNVAVSDGTVTQTVTTDQNGVYLATGLAAKQYTVTPQPPAGLRSFPVSSNVMVGPAGPTCPPTANFTLQGLLKIQGRLTTCGGNVVAFATVSLSTAQFPNLATYNVGTDGRYTFAGLPPGQYTVTPTHPTFTFNPLSQNIALATVNVVQNFAGTANNGTLSGRALNANRAPLAGITITVRDYPSRANARTMTTAADGTFTFTLPLGNYSVVPTSAQAGLVFNPTVAFFSVGGANPSCNNYLLFFGNVNAVSIVALEVVQVCQDWQNNVPLVQNKATLVRAFLTPTAPSTNTVRVTGATLQVRSGATTRTLRPRMPGVDARTDYAARRNIPASSLAFDLPTTLATGTVTLTLQWPGGILTTYQDPQGQQTAVVNNATTVTFQSMPALPINWVLVNWKFGATTTPAPMSLIAAQRRRLLAGLPTISLAPDNTGRSLDWNPPIDPTTPGSPENEERLRNDLQTQLRRLRIGDRSKTVYHGVMTGTGVGGQAGGIPGNTSFDDMSSDPATHKNTPVHELGHVLGQAHDTLAAFGITYKANLQIKMGICMEYAAITAPDYPMDKHPPNALAPTLGPMQLGDFHYIYGWDPSDNTYISPFNGTPDLMSYCSWTTPWTWPGSYTYTNMFNSLLSRYVPAPKDIPIRKDDTQVPCWIVAGEVEAVSDTLTLDPVLPVLESQQPSAPDPGPYTLVLLDSSNNILESVPFAPQLPVTEDDESSNLLYENFVFEIPQVAGVAAVQLYDQDVVLTNRLVAPHSPIVQFSTPVPGAILTNGPFNFTWIASDADGNPLTYWLQYSSDGGADWETLAFDLTNTQFTLSSDVLSGTTNGYFQVTASDGFNAASALTGPVTLPVQPPTVVIDTPMPGDVYTGDQPIILQASAWDMVDGDLPDSQFQWTGQS
jgi:uncharacterized repeat protein (TIGR01451 family)